MHCAVAVQLPECLLDFIGAKDDGDGGDSWSCKTYKAPVKLSPPTNQHSTFYGADVIPVAHPEVSALKGTPNSSTSTGIRTVL